MVSLRSLLCGVLGQTTWQVPQYKHWLNQEETGLLYLRMLPSGRRTSAAADCRADTSAAAAAAAARRALQGFCGGSVDGLQPLPRLSRAA